MRQPLLLSLTERPSYKVSWLRGRDALRVYRHDFIEAHIRPSVAFHGAGIVNHADKLTLVIDSV
ncbi:MAG TPA: hypothetical protein VKT81_23195, partial [Bryobacteraceae bacterium]|nr:hypothetical protein [Bryobacteraceae bacterium]